MASTNEEYVKVSDAKAVNMEQQTQAQPHVMYAQQPQAVHTTVVTTADSSETNALLLLIFGTICCPILCCVNVCLYSKYSRFAFRSLKLTCLQ